MKKISLEKGLFLLNEIEKQRCHKSNFKLHQNWRLFPRSWQIFRKTFRQWII